MLKQTHIRTPIAISLGAIAGALCRYYIGSQITQIAGDAFPWGTFSVNLSGCFLMGVVIAVGARRWSLRPEVLSMVTTGFLGSYTTFSSYGLEVALLSDRSGTGLVFLYWFGSPLLGIVCLLVGMALAEWGTAGRGDRS